MNFLISTIIPVFNCEKYIESSINSVINQSINFNNLQLIIIDDGSLDNSKKIIQTYIKNYNNIEYYYQENSGVGIAIISLAVYGTFIGAPAGLGFVANYYGVNNIFLPILFIFIILFLPLIVFKGKFKL